MRNGRIQLALLIYYCQTNAVFEIGVYLLESQHAQAAGFHYDVMYFANDVLRDLFWASERRFVLGACTATPEFV